ncbi:MAG: type II toxin-antitoxin system VapC family toxin [Thermoplasmatota archaeon]
MILDTSSIYRAIESGRIDVLLHEKTLDLAAYELGNVVWKHAVRETISLSEGKKLMNILGDCLSLMEVLRLGMQEHVYKIAVEAGITYYDASFLYAARAYGEPLVSEDRVLSKAARSMHIPVHGVNAIM